MDTTAIQRALIALGYDLGPAGADGIAGRKTTLALQIFQRGRGLVADGKAGPLTIKALQAAIADKRPPPKPIERVTIAALTALAKSFGGRPNAAVVQGIVDNRELIAAGGIDTPARIAEFLAQACLETDYFRTLEEYASGAAYEGRRDLGNTVAGDGRRYKGRGIFQCTGRANYAAYGRRLGIDLLKEPQLAARPDISVRIATLYWADKGLNPFADRGDTRAISRAINRGSAKAKSPANHEADRVRIAAEARLVFGA